MTDAPAQRPAPEGSVAARWPGYVDGLAQCTPRLSLGIPALDDVVTLHPDRKQLVVVALPWEPGGETPFVIAQAAAKQAANPLCICPSWSTYWDGALEVQRLEDGQAPTPPPYDLLAVQAATRRHQFILVDQFSRMHWDTAASHEAREDVVREAGRRLLAMSKRASVPVVVFVRRKTRDIVRMSVDDLRSDGALTYDADVAVMVDPHPQTATADLLVVKHRNGPEGLRPGVPWPVLPRTIYRRTSS